MATRKKGKKKGNQVSSSNLYFMEFIYLLFFFASLSKLVLALADITTTIIITTSLIHSSPLSPPSLSLQPPEGEKWQSGAREPTTNTMTEKEEDKKTNQKSTSPR